MMNNSIHKLIHSEYGSAAVKDIQKFRKVSSQNLNGFQRTKLLKSWQFCLTFLIRLQETMMNNSIHILKKNLHKARIWWYVTHSFNQPSTLATDLDIFLVLYTDIKHILSIVVPTSKLLIEVH